MKQTLIDNCYSNNFGIDLKQYHKDICETNSNEEVLVTEINNNNRVIFEDGVSSTFELTLNNNLLYLLGDKTCYPCSKVVKSAYGSQFNWTSCLVMPGTVKVFGETDIRKSAIVVSLFSDLIPKIPNKERFYNFISGLRYTFSGCNWFKGISDVSKYVRQTSFWDYKQKMEQLF